MRYIAIVLLAAIVSGCVSSEKLRSKNPSLVLANTKDARAVSACITARWESGGAFGMTMPIDNKILADGYSVSYKAGQTVELMADVHDLESGSTTEFYKVSWVAGVSRFESAVKECQ